MKREPSAPVRATRSRRRGPESGSGGVWTISAGDPDFPPQLESHPQHADWRTIYGIGNRDILHRKSVGLICSVQCPGSVVMKTFDAIRELRDAGIVIAGGFHSPMEQECLEFLLRGEQPVIICPARHPDGRWSAEIREALELARLLIVSPFGGDVRRATKVHARTRNEFAAAVSTAVLIPHSSVGGKAEAVARQILEDGQPVFTFDDESNSNLLQLGAEVYGIDKTRRLCNSGSRSPSINGLPSRPEMTT